MSQVKQRGSRQKSRTEVFPEHRSSEAGIAGFLHPSHRHDSSLLNGSFTRHETHHLQRVAAIFPSLSLRALGSA